MVGEMEIDVVVFCGYVMLLSDVVECVVYLVCLDEPHIAVMVYVNV